MRKLLFFYATWCPPCKHTDKTVITPLKEKYGDKIQSIDEQK